MKLRLLKLFAVLCASLFVYACGGGGGSDDGSSELAGKVPVSTADSDNVARLDLAADKIDLNTSSDDSTEITITTRDMNNVAMSGVNVNLSATAGILSSSNVTTDERGRATFTFSTGPEKSNQLAIITASTAALTKNFPITLSGTILTLATEKNSLFSGTNEETSVSVQALDANNNPITDANITLSSTAGNRLTAGDQSGSSITLTTDIRGTTDATLTAMNATDSDTITASGLGAMANIAVNITNAKLDILPPMNNPISVGSTIPLTMTWLDNSGTPVTGEEVTFTTTGGYFDNTPDLTTFRSNTDGSGQATVTFTAGNVATPADITVTNGSESFTRRIQVAAVDPDQLSLQAFPTVLRPSIGDVRSSSTVTAILRDPNGQLVSEETVVFSLVDGPGGGEVITPGTAVTDANGTASVSFLSGSAPSAQEGVVIRAVAQSKQDVYAETSLTIGNEATSIVLGTTNVVSEELAGDPPLPVGYAVPISVLVVDINGNPIPNATVNLGAYTLFAYTGFELDPFDIKSGFYESIEFVPKDGPNTAKKGRFINEDLNRNGFLDDGEDLNGNGRLDPGNVVTLPKTVVTDADGLASFELKYAKDYGNWVDVEITASTQVFGDRSSAKLVVPLRVLYLDVPYPDSPFGRSCDFFQEEPGLCFDQ